MNERLRENLIALGAIKPGATDEEAAAQVASYVANQRAREGEREKAVANEKAATEALDAEKKRADDAEAALVTSKKAHAELVVANAVREGRVETGKADDEVKTLANSKEFAKDSEALAKREVKFKVAATANRTERPGGSTAGDPLAEYKSVVNEKTAKLEAGGKPYADAHAQAIREVANESPELAELATVAHAETY